MQETERKRGIAFLDKPVLGGVRLEWWTLLCALLIVLAVGTRFWDLGSRAYSHDESIHASWSWDLYTGRGYRHNPTYHGPFLYHFTAFIFFLFGDSDVTARVSPAIFGVIVALLPLFMRKWLGKTGSLAAMALMVISPIIMNRSRYLRMDIYIIAFQLVMVVAIMKYLEQRKAGHLYLMAAMMSLAFATKETAYIYQAMFGIFVVVLFLARWLGQYRAEGRAGSLAGTIQRWRGYAEFDLLILFGTLCLPLLTAFPVKMLGFNPIDYQSQEGILRSGIALAVMFAISIAIGVWWDWQRWLIGAGIFWVIFAGFYTTMFTNGQGFATGTLGSLGYWLEQQGVKRGNQPWFYYLLLVPMYDFLPLLFSLFGIGYGTIRWLKEPNQVVDGDDAPRQAPFIPFLIFWTVLSWAMYTWAAEKMPWLALNISVPVVLLAGWYIGQLLDKIDFADFKARLGWAQVALIPLFLVLLVTLIGLKPFQGTSLDQLGDTMMWVIALLATVGLAVAMFFTGRKLGWRHNLHALFLMTLIVLAAFTVRFAWMATYKNGDVPVELMVYAQGAPDIPVVMDEIIDMSERMYGDLDMQVAYDDESSWPFVWYLRNFKNALYYAKKPSGPLDAPVVIVGDGNEPGVKPFLGGKYFRREYKLIWWPSENYKNMTLSDAWSNVVDPEKRETLWKILFYRDYPYDLDNWPHYNNFIMYVRKDVAAQLWDYGPEVVATEIELPGEAYDKVYRQVQPQALWGMQGSAEGQFQFPKGIALDDAGNMYVADSQNHRVVKFDANGNHMMQFGSEGNAPGQFQEPWGVVVDNNGQIYVADTWNHRVQKFDAQGRFMTTWGVFGDTGGDAAGDGTWLYGPRDITVDEEGNLYVTDTGNKRVVKYDPNGAVLGSWGGFGVEVGQFMEPVGIALDRLGNVYVADTWNRRIQKFDPSFRPMAQWPVVGWEGESVVNKPYIAVDAQLGVYVTDPEMFRVIKFDPQGQVVAVWGQSGSDMNSLNLPTGIAIDDTNNIYVTDSNNHRIAKYGPIN